MQRLQGRGETAVAHKVLHAQSSISLYIFLRRGITCYHTQQKSTRNHQQQEVLIQDISKHAKVGLVACFLRVWSGYTALLIEHTRRARQRCTRHPLWYLYPPNTRVPGFTQIVPGCGMHPTYQTDF